VQRRFWSGSDGRRSRIELVADQVCVREEAADDGVDSEPVGDDA
jgi:hypothetical protein